MIKHIARQGLGFEGDEEGGQQEFPEGIDTKAMMKEIKPMKSGLTGEEFDKSYA